LIDVFISSLLVGSWEARTPMFAGAAVCSCFFCGDSTFS